MKNRAYGWQKVFAFTFVQLIKTPAMIVTTIVLCLLCAIAVPFSTTALFKDDVKDTTSIARLLIVDNTELELEKWLDVKQLEFDGVLPENIVFVKETKDKLTENLQTEEYSDTAAIIISYSAESGSFNIVGYYGSKGSVLEDDISDLTTLIANNFMDKLTEVMEVSDEQLSYIRQTTKREIKHLSAGEGGAPEIKEEEGSKGANINFAEYSVGLIFLVLGIFMIALSGEQIATSVAQEKASKVVEYILTSVKPLALMIGKILAVFALTVLQMLLVAGCFMGSLFVTLLMHPQSGVTVSQLVSATFSNGQESVDFSMNIDIKVIPLMIIIFLAGLLFYAVIAALAGACVSKLEELTEGMKLYTFTMLIGAYGAMGVVMADLIGTTPAVLKYIVEILPITAPFFCPTYLAIGKMTFVEGLISCVTMVGFLCLILWFASSVYENLIYYNGNTVKLKQLLGMRKNRAGKEKGDEK